jgi:transposase InsO family protein
MPWRESTCMSERAEFIHWARQPGRNFSAVCAHYSISRKTGYKWEGRAAAGGEDALLDRSRRPAACPHQTDQAMEERVCALRREYPAWGPRKLYNVLKADGVQGLPALSTISAILRRHDLLTPGHRKQRDWRRFEEDAPNGLWQMDFKGHFPAGRGRCHPLTVLDDHSRFNIQLAACADERATTVQAQLTAAFQRYGLPDGILTDNGSPWGGGGGHPHTHLTAWLIRLGVSVLHGRPYHPQTQGKEERFHRTLQLEVLAARPRWHSLGELQDAFDVWREVYNFRRPHEAVGDRPPATRYTPSERLLPAVLPPIAYAPGDVVRQVHDRGRVKFRGRLLRVSHAFIGQPVALRAVDDGVWDVYFCHQRIARADLREPPVEV